MTGPEQGESEHSFTGLTADHSVPVAATCACDWIGDPRDNWLLAVEDYADHKAADTLAVLREFVDLKPSWYGSTHWLRRKARDTSQLGRDR